MITTLKLLKQINAHGFLPSHAMQQFIILIVCLLLSSYAHASTWTAKQGDVVEVMIDSHDAIKSLYCFGKPWPIKTMADGMLHGWIGVDLKKKAGSYKVVWQGAKKHRDTLTVMAGTFRISRITVKKSMAQFDAKAIARIRHDQKALLNSYTIPVDAAPAIRMGGRPVDGVVSTPFGAQRYVNGKARSPHSGLDIAAPRYTPIVAPLGGKVILRESMFLNGNTIVIGHGNGLVSIYCHMQDFAVQEGDWVKTGQKIGTVGSSGRSTGPHLHWGVRFGMARVNPQSLIH